MKFLAVDHIHNDGNEHRKVVNQGRLYTWLRENAYPQGFQVLCFNCNYGKSINGGVCPHKGAGEMNVWQLVESATQNIGFIVPMLQ